MGRVARANIGYVRSALEPDEAEVRGKDKDGLHGRVLGRDLGLHHGIAARVDRGQAGGGAQGRQMGGLTFARGDSRVRKPESECSGRTKHTQPPRSSEMRVRRVDSGWAWPGDARRRLRTRNDGEREDRRGSGDAGTSWGGGCACVCVCVCVCVCAHAACAYTGSWWRIGRVRACVRAHRGHGQAASSKPTCLLPA